MSAKFVAVEGCTVEVQSPASGQVSINAQPSSKVSAGGSGVYSGMLDISVSNVTQAALGSAVPGTATGAILATASDTKADGQPVMRVGDEITLVAADAQTSTSSGPVPGPITLTVKITDAGQAKVEGT